MPRWKCNICGELYNDVTDAELCHASIEEIWRCICCGGVWISKLDAASCCADIVEMIEDEGE